MVTIRKKIRGKETYFYLEHIIRKGKKVEKKELYLGKKIPKDIEEIKRKFFQQIFREKWEKILEKIKENCQKELRKMPKSAREKEIETFTIQFTYDTQRIEGSTLTLRETADLLEKGITPKGKPIHDIKEAEAHRKIFLEMLNLKEDLSLPFEQTKPDVVGKIRNYRVRISGSKFQPPYPAEIYPILRDFIKWYQKSKNVLHPVELAGLVHFKFVTIHPFADGNGRISRLMMNFVLQKFECPFLNIPYKNRNSYYTMR